MKKLFFTTLFILSIGYSPMLVSAQVASSITTTTVGTGTVGNGKAILKGSVTSNNFAARTWFKWGSSSTTLTNITPKQNINPVPANFETTISYPVAGVSYYFQACADDESTPESCGAVKSFTTTGTLAVSTTGTRSVGKNVATIIGGVNFGNQNGGTVWFKWGLTENSLSTKTPDQQITGIGREFNTILETLKADTTYYFQACAKNSTTPEGVCSVVKNFKTNAGSSNIIIDPGSSTILPSNVQLLAPLPGLTDINENITISQYLSTIFKVGIGIATFLAVVFLVLGGIQYATTDAIGGKEDGKEKMWNAIIGLILALSAYVILNTINPDLVNFNFLVKQVTIEGIEKDIDDSGETLEFASPLPGEACPEKTGSDTCQNLSVKYRSQGKQAEKTINQKLQAFNNSLGILKNQWSVTEAWAPSRTHKAACHKNGTCVDANFDTPSLATPESVKLFIETASANGLCAIYEVKTIAEEERFETSGVNKARVKNFGSWISAPHFSIYGSNCK